MNRKEYHTTLGALVCFCFASFFFFFVYTFGNHQKGKELTIELATEPPEIVSSIFKLTICDVVMARHQFSWANKRSIRWKHPKGPLWNKSYEIANRILKRGLELKNFEHALYYHADYVNPKWASSEYYIEKIGTHIFYYRSL